MKVIVTALMETWLCTPSFTNSESAGKLSVATDFIESRRESCFNGCSLNLSLNHSYIKTFCLCPTQLFSIMILREKIQESVILQFVGFFS